jgi:hypothetical protein
MRTKILKFVTLSDSRKISHADDDTYDTVFSKYFWLFFFSKDLSESFLEPSTVELQNEFYVYSLRSLCISTDHPLEFFTLLFKTAPFLQHIKLIQTYNSSLKLKTNNQLYDCINFVISQCQQRLKCLRRLHIQLRSISDQVKFADLISFLNYFYFQIFLQSSSIPSIPVSYEIINC